jgi:hypothetical protein
LRRGVGIARRAQIAVEQQQVDQPLARVETLARFQRRQRATRFAVEQLLVAEDQIGACVERRGSGSAADGGERCGIEPAALLDECRCRMAQHDVGIVARDACRG